MGNLFFWIDWNVLLLFAAMMAVSGFAAQTGLFQYVIVYWMRTTRGNAGKLYALFFFFAAVLGALFDPVSAVLIVVPPLLRTLAELQWNAVPWAASLVIAANVGSIATMTGSVSNMMIIEAAEMITFSSYVLYMALPVSFTALISGWLMYRLFIRPSRLIDTKRAVLKLPLGTNVLRRSSTRLVVIIVALMFAAMAAHPLLGIPVSWPPAAAALLLWWICRSEQPFRQLAAHIEWRSLLFIFVLYIASGLLAESGAADWLANALLDMVAGSSAFSVLFMLWLPALLAAVLTAAPVVAAFIPIIQELGILLQWEHTENMNLLWFSLAFGAGIGAGSSLLGSAAALIAANMSEKTGQRISVRRFAAFGLMAAVIGLAAATAYTWLQAPQLFQ